jgi:hypothetical protein
VLFLVLGFSLLVTYNAAFVLVVPWCCICNALHRGLNLIFPQTISQLEAENSRLKLSIQESREALDHSKNVEVREGQLPERMSFPFIFG